MQSGTTIHPSRRACTCRPAGPVLVPGNTDANTLGAEEVTVAPLMFGVFALAGALALWVRRVLRRLTRRARRRGSNAHVNADGSPKREYHSERAARVAALEYQRDLGGRMATYRCARGRHWHIGHAR